MTVAPLTLLSLGAGVQSTTLALLAIEGALPRPDAAIFADTGWEPAAVYQHLNRLEVALTDAGIPLHRVSNGNLRRDAVAPDHRFVSVPWFTLQPDDSDPDRPATEAELLADRREREGMGRRQCTSEYKLNPIRRKARELLGATPPDYRRVPKGRTAVQWIGFSTDEIHRVNNHKDDVSYLSVTYPLLDLGMSRTDCQRWLKRRGWSTVKSACIGCPFHGNAQWRTLRDTNPVEWADAVDFDAQIRRGGARGDALTGEAFLHRSRLPLSIAPIDKVTRTERAGWQYDALELLKDLEEEGDPDGCSPYGCRSGGVL